MSERYAGYGTTFKRGDGGDPESFATIAGVHSIGGPGLEVETEDATAHDSSNAWEEVVATIKRSGEVSVELRWDPGDSGHQDLLNDLNGRGTQNYQIVWSDTDDSTWDLPCIVTGFEPEAEFDGVLGTSVTLKVAGEPTFNELS